MSFNVYLAQVNNSYGRNVFLPYSVGLLQAYAQSDPIIKDNFYFKEFIYLREPIGEIVGRLVRPAVFGISCYIWNWEYSIALARAVKQSYPKCLIVLGGPHCPVRSEMFFITHDFVDIIVHYEGELAFSEILRRSLLTDPEYEKIEGLSINVGRHCVKTPARNRIGSIDTLPSPYLTGVFDSLMSQPYDFHASHETHRGCPYSCTFCDWGSNTMASVKAFGDERLLEEIRWFSKNKIDLVYNCDANYGLFKRDIDLTRKMAEIKRETGFPKKFRAAYAKNSNDSIYEIAKILNNADMNKGITLSFQSMDDHTLEIVKRKNIKISDFRRMMERYNAENIATYSEVIIGLPGETYDSFADGICLLLECGQHDSIQTYNCEMLPNSEMNEAPYKEKHGIKTARVPVLFFHGTPDKGSIQEYYELVVGTASMPGPDWLKAQRIAWIIQCLHCLSLTQYVAIFLQQECGMSYRCFYEALLTLADNRPATVLGKAASNAGALFSGIPYGRGFGIVDKRFGDITWPTEEGSFLSLMAQRDDFYNELKDFVEPIISLCAGSEMADDVMQYQRSILIDPFKVTGEMRLRHNLHEYFCAARIGKKIPIEHREFVYAIEAEKDYKGDLETYAREVIWYGRKGGRFRHTGVRRIDSDQLATSDPKQA